MTLADTIKKSCGIRQPQQDLGISENDFDLIIDDYIVATQEWIGTYTQRTFTTYPKGLEQIIIEIVCNMIQNQLLRQDSPILDEDSSRTRSLTLNAVTPDIKLRLTPYIKRKIRMFGVGTKSQYDELINAIDEDDIDDVV